MKVIDLLNMISKGEELPKKVKYYDLTYEYNEYLIGINKYRGIEHIGIFLFDVVSNINDEVEVIEEDKKIEKEDEILTTNDLECPITYNEMKIWKQVIKEHNKINEIIDKLEN